MSANSRYDLDRFRATLARLAANEPRTRRFIGIIDAMTAEERNHPQRLNSPRIARIATGAGVTTEAVRALVAMAETVHALQQNPPPPDLVTRATRATKTRH